MLRRRIPLMLIVAALATLVVTGPSAARPSSPTAAALSASPNPVQAGSQYTVRGCGFVTGKQVNIVIDGGMFFSVAVDAGGCISYSWWAGSAGTVDDIKAYQNLRGQRQTLMAQTTVTVI